MRGDEADGAQVEGGTECIYKDGRTVRREPGQEALGSVVKQILHQVVRDFAILREDHVFESRLFK